MSVTVNSDAGSEPVAMRDWLGTSWKMNKTVREAVTYADDLVAWAADSDVDATVCIFPAFTALSAVAQALARSTSPVPIQVGAQNMHWADAGSYTGEISPLMVRDAGAHAVEIGHFERRASFGETDATVNRKVKAALRHGLVALVCVGDSSSVRDFGVVNEFVGMQLKVALSGVSAASLQEVIVAYEPGWAIGAGGVGASTKEVALVHGHLRSVLVDLYGEAPAREVRIVYGGSVTRENVPDYAAVSDVDGLFVGRAAWDVSEFVNIIEAFCAARGPRSAPSQEVAVR